MNERKIGEVENYTDAFLATIYLLLVMSLVMIWGVWGYVAALTACGGLHWLIRHFGLRRERAEADWDARVSAAIERARKR
ncbi:MAG: hypothetical protein WBA67_14735 [Jannaschia sp.]